MSHARILEMLEESGFDHDEMAEVVDALAPLDELADRAPAPSVELAALLGPASNGASHPTASRSRARGAAVGAVVIALSSVGATGLSAAANTLPRPFQQEVAEFSRDYLPFDLPEPPPPGQPFGAELPQAPSSDGGQIGPRPVPLTKDSGRDAYRPSFPSASPSAGPSAAAASSQPSFMPSPSPTYSSSPSSSPSADEPSPSGEPSGKTPSANQGGEDQKPKRPPKDKHQGFGPGDGKEHKPGKGKDKDKDKGDGEGQGNGPIPGAGPGEGDGSGQGDGGGQGEGNDGGGAPDLPPPLSQPDPPPPPDPLPELLPGVDLPTDGSLPGT